MAEFVHTITTEDVGKIQVGAKTCAHCGHIGGGAYTPSFLGTRVMPHDVDKRIYRVRNDADDHWVYQVESSAQLAIRQGIQVQKIRA